MNFQYVCGWMCKGLTGCAIGWASDGYMGGRVDGWVGVFQWMGKWLADWVDGLGDWMCRCVSEGLRGRVVVGGWVDDWQAASRNSYVPHSYVTTKPTIQHSASTIIVIRAQHPPFSIQHPMFRPGLTTETLSNQALGNPLTELPVYGKFSRKSVWCEALRKPPSQASGRTSPPPAIGPLASRTEGSFCWLLTLLPSMLACAWLELLLVVGSFRCMQQPRRRLYTSAVLASFFCPCLRAVCQRPCSWRPAQKRVFADCFRTAGIGLEDKCRFSSGRSRIQTKHLQRVGVFPSLGPHTSTLGSRSNLGGASKS